LVKIRINLILLAGLSIMFLELNHGEFDSQNYFEVLLKAVVFMIEESIAVTFRLVNFLQPNLLIPRANLDLS
jgi:hypothetical protein